MSKTKFNTFTNFNTLPAWETSRYWMGNFADRLDDGGKADIIELASFQRAIANFVRITTGKNIPVKFNNKDESFTDNKTVVLSAKIDENKFDCNVGLALHEASHILLSNFTLLRDLVSGYNVKANTFVNSICNQYNIDDTYSGSQILGIIKDLVNIIEDRRIDRFVYTNAPGYRGYYLAMYAEYFNDKSIDLALKYNYKVGGKLADYMFHITNMMNPNFNANAMPLLKQIYDTIDLRNIQRLQNTEDVLNVALQVADILREQIAENVGASPEESKQGSQAGSGNEGGNEPGSAKQ